MLVENATDSGALLPNAKRFFYCGFLEDYDPSERAETISWLTDTRLAEYWMGDGALAVCRAVPQRGWAVAGLCQDVSGPHSQHATIRTHSHVAEDSSPNQKSIAWRIGPAIVRPVFDVRYEQTLAIVGQVTQPVQRDGNTESTASEDGAACWLIQRHGSHERHQPRFAMSAMVSKLFCYGTLMQGECRHSSLLRWNPIHMEQGRVPGQLVNLGNYPGLLPPDSAGSEVSGELYAFDTSISQWDQALACWDHIEGFHGISCASNHYMRLLTRVRVESGRDEIAWVYVYVGQRTGAKLIPGNSWR